ncbi:HNH endonuclease [Pseudonocardia saturnea]
MSINVESRKRLWGRSGGKCAICKENLFEVVADYDTIVGEEAHIIARSPGGPRRELLTESTRIDDYSNLILLCPRDHTIVDAQPARWTVERLREVKAVHEEWVQSLPPEERPVRLVAGHDYWTKNFYPVADGPSLWRIVAEAHSYKFDHPADSSEDELDYLAGLFDAIKDWGEMASFMHSRVEQRNAERSLGESVEDAMARSLVLVGRRVEMTMTGGIGPDSSWQQAEIQAWRPEQLLEALASQSDGEQATTG